MLFLYLRTLPQSLTVIIELCLTIIVVPEKLHCLWNVVNSN